METEIFKKTCRRFLNEKVAEVRASQPVSKVLQGLGAQFAHFIVVRENTDRVCGVIATGDFLKWFEEVKTSRFPGDADPGKLLLRQCLSLMPGTQFQHVELRSLQQPVAEWLRACDPCHVLIMQGAQVLGIIPKEHFSEWIEQMKAPPPSPMQPMI